MSRANINRAESGVAVELSDFTSDLLENLKGEFKNNLRRSSSQPCKENKVTLSLLADVIQSSHSTQDDISDEVFILNHIINCTKSLVEVLDLKKGNDTNDVSLFYSGLLNHISKLVKAALTLSSNTGHEASSELSNLTNPSFDQLFQSDVDRLFVTTHTLMIFPHMACSDHITSSKTRKVPLLNYAICNSNDINLVKAVYFSNPEAVKIPDLKDGSLPLHWASLGSDTRIVQFLLEKYPAAAGVVDNSGYLPLHWAVNQDSPCIPVYKLLLAAYPQGVSIVSPKNGTLPLHWCVNRSNPDIALVKELILAHAAGLRTACHDGWLPLHYCVNHGKVSQSVLALLLNRYPNAAMFKNEDGQLPVHRLLDRDDSSKKALKQILEVAPECLSVADQEGYLPLHVALDGSNPPSWRLVKLLLQHGPDAVKQRTRHNFLPLHIAMKMNDVHGGEQESHSRPSSPSTPAAQDDPLSDDEFNQETIDKLNGNRYLSIVQELTSLYPEAVHDVATEVVPTEVNVEDLYNYSGEWKKTRWTPMSRAISKGKNSPIALLLRPFQKQKKAVIKGAATKVLAAGRLGLGGPLVTAVQGQKLGPLVQTQTSPHKGGSSNGNGSGSGSGTTTRVPRRPPPRAKRGSSQGSQESQGSQGSSVPNPERQVEGKRPKSNSEEQVQQKLQIQQLAEENRLKARIYTADMKAEGYFKDNDISVDEDDNALKFDRDGSTRQFA